MCLNCTWKLKRFTIFQRGIFVKKEYENDQSFPSPTDSLKLRTAKVITHNNESQKLSQTWNMLQAPVQPRKLVKCRSDFYFWLMLSFVTKLNYGDKHYGDKQKYF